MSLPLFDRASNDLVDRLLAALSDGTWQHRDWLAKSLQVSVRQVREAASQSRGRVVSGQKGLRLTIFCSQEELEDALAAMRGQIHEMTLRSLAISHVWTAQNQKSA